MGCCYAGYAGGGVAEIGELVENRRWFIGCNAEKVGGWIVMTECRDGGLYFSYLLLVTQGDISYCKPPLLTSLITIVVLLARCSAAS